MPKNWFFGLKYELFSWVLSFFPDGQTASLVYSFIFLRPEKSPRCKQLEMSVEKSVQKLCLPLTNFTLPKMICQLDIKMNWDDIHRLPIHRKCWSLPPVSKWVVNWPLGRPKFFKNICLTFFDFYSLILK